MVPKLNNPIWPNNIQIESINLRYIIHIDNISWSVSSLHPPHPCGKPIDYPEAKAKSNNHKLCTNSISLPRYIYIYRHGNAYSRCLRIRVWGKCHAVWTVIYMSNVSFIGMRLEIETIALDIYKSEQSKERKRIRPIRCGKSLKICLSLLRKN